MNKAERYLLNEKLDEIYNDLTDETNKGNQVTAEVQNKIAKIKELLGWI